jgi:hypothetical protein
VHRHAIALFAALTLVSCARPQPQPGEYALPIEQAFARLSSSKLPELVQRANCGLDVSVNVESEPPGTVTWYVLSDDVEQVRFMAYLTPLPENRTKVSLAVWNDAAGDKAYDGSKFDDTTVLKQPIRPWLNEQISAVLESRPVDKDKLWEAYSSHPATCFIHMRDGKRYPSLVRETEWSPDPRPIDRRRPGAPDPAAGRPTTIVVPGGR